MLHILQRRAIIPEVVAPSMVKTNILLNTVFHVLLNEIRYMLLRCTLFQERPNSVIAATQHLRR